MILGLSLFPTLLLVPAVVFHQAKPVAACAGHDHDHHHDITFQRNLQEEEYDAADYCGFVDPSPQEMKEVQGKMQKWKLNKSKGAKSSTRRLTATDGDGPIIVPTYFHIISQSEGGLGSEALNQVEIQMQILNNRFAPYGFQFNLTNQTHTVSSKWFDLNGQAHFNNENGNTMESEMKFALRKGGRNALNVYTLDPGNSGMASFPTILDSDKPHLDGVMLRWYSMPFLSTNPKYDLGFTLVHEVGHWLGLYHTHTGSCTCGGDLVDDTPSTAGPNRGCLPDGYDSCPSLPGTDPIHNYMSYSWDSCYEEFTPGQVERMRFFWEMFREPEVFGNDGTDDPTAADVPDADTIPCSPIGGHYVELELKTDVSSLETTWDLVAVSSGDVVQKSMGGYGQNTEYHFGPYCLLPGIYTFTIYDAAGDGIKGYSASSQSGHYKLTLDGQKPLKNGGNFDCKESTDFIIE